MKLTSADFVNWLALHRFVEPRQVDELQPAIRKFSSPLELAKHVVALGLISDYQAKCVLKGEIDKLTVDSFRLIDPIGAGGMGQVFKALHVRLNRLVAIKMISPAILKTVDNPDELLRRFEREAQAAAQLMHPNIVTLFDYNVIAGMPYIAMEYVAGMDLSELVEKNGPLSYPRATDYIRQAATGLQHAHEAGLVHRDIKPHNLLIALPGKNAVPGQAPGIGIRIAPRGYGTVKISDLGLAKVSRDLETSKSCSSLTQQGAVLGTPDFVAPEQARDASRVDIRADLYSLGCTYYYLLTGQLPFPGEGTIVEKIMAHQHEEPVSVASIRPNTPPEMAAVVKKLMSKRPDDRYQTPLELVDELDNLSMELWSNASTPAQFGDLPARLAPEDDHVTPDQMPARKNNENDPFLLPAKKVAILDSHKSMVKTVAFSPGSHWLTSGDLAGMVRLWDFASGRPVEHALDKGNCQAEIGQVFFGRKGASLFVSTCDMDPKIWHWDIYESRISERKPFPAYGFVTNCHVISPDGSTIAAGSGGVIVLHKLKSTGRPSVLRGHTAEIRTLAYSPNGKRIYSAGDDKSIIVWEPDRMWGCQRGVMHGHDAAVTALAVAGDGKHVASASLDGNIALWNVSASLDKPIATLKGHQNGVRSVRFVAKTMLLLSICERGNIVLWDAEEKVKLRQWQSDKGMIHSMALSSDGRFVATGLGDGRVVVYDLNLLVEAGATASWARMPFEATANPQLRILLRIAVIR